MQDYLQGYLKVLPESQRMKIEEIIRENQEVLTSQTEERVQFEEEFTEVIRRLAEDHEPATSFIPQLDRLDPDKYNEFYSSVYMDLNMLFLESELIESAIVNYDRIFEGILSDLRKEVEALKARVDSLRLTAEGEDGLIIKQFDFTTKAQMETDTKTYAHLFRDRDGSAIPLAVIERNQDQYYLSIGKTLEVDCLRNEKGETTAKIEIVDRRGIPVKLTGEEAGRYRIENAIDGSLDTYCGEVILTDNPILVPMMK